MSDLIDLDKSGETRELAAPLLPCPSNVRELSDEPRPSLAPGDNPFDRAVREVNRFTALQHDPFEIVTPRRLSSSFTSTKANPQIQPNGRSCSLTNLNTVEPNISILIEPPSPQDLSILNDSQMNDSFGKAQMNESFSKAVGPNSSFIRGMSNPLLNLSQSSIYSNASSASTYSNDLFNKAFRIDSSSASSISNLSLDQLTSVSPPDFDVLPPSDDESELIHLSKSPRSFPKEPVESEPAEDTTNVVKEVESSIFSLSDPKKRELALTRFLELKNLFKHDNPHVAKLLDDLANTCGLNCDNNSELLALCLQPSSEEDAQQNLNQEDKNLRPTMENLMSFVQHLVPDLSKIDPTTKHLLHNLEQKLQRIREDTESTPKKETTKLPRSKSLSSLRRSTTPDSRSKMGIPTLRNSSPRKSPAVSSRMKNMNLDSRNNRISVPDVPIANTKLAADIKGKLKRKVVESVPKKGPLKAVIPVDNMQKTAILKNPPSPPDSLRVTEKNPIASSTPIIRRSYSQIKPRNLSTKENYLKPSSPRENGKQLYSPIKMRSPRRGIPIFFRAKKLTMSPLRINNQNVQIKSTPKAHGIDFTQPSRNDKENQY